MSEQQKLLQFESKKETDRRERVERLLKHLGCPEKLTTAAKYFDYHEATRIAEQSNEAARER